MTVRAGLPEMLARALAAAAAVVLLASCAPDAGGSSPAGPTVPTAPIEPESIDGPLSDTFDLAGAEMWVGSEDVPSQRILGYVAVEALKSVGAEVGDEVGFGGSLEAREALQAGEIDLYWERIGPAWTVYLREAPVTNDVDELYHLVAMRDAEENGVIWLAPAHFSDGPGFAMASEFAEALDIETNTDMATYIDDGMPTSICVTSEFMIATEQGRQSYEDALGVTFPDVSIQELDPEPIYPNTGDGTCLFGQVGRVNGRVRQYDLRVLDDDVGVLPPANPAMTVREDIYSENPELGPIFALLSDSLDQTAMQKMTERVEVDGDDPQDVAHDWLVEEGFISP